jgi:uncharacterized protein (DUF1501 family)
MRRRDFLRFLASASATSVAATLTDPFRPRLGFAQTTGLPTLVVIFQRGGCDGLNTVVPFGDPNYQGLRPGIGIAPPNPSNPNSAVNLDGFFGLHPRLSALEAIWTAGDLAVFPAAHYPSASRSHFDGQRNIESAANANNIDGWLNRHFVTLPQPAALRAVGFESSLPHSLRGQEIVSSFTGIANFTLGLSQQDEQELLTEINRVYSQQPDSSKAYRDLVTGFGRVLVNDLAVLSGIDTGSYAPENGALYPSSTYGRQLREIAQLVKEDVGLEVAAVSIGGWDTHSSEGGANGSQASRHLAQGIAALYTDLGSLRDNVVILTMTEFGRTALENASGGTDHGNAAAWFAAGGRINGGIYGPWPGLRTQDLVNGRYLNHSVDFRDIMADILTTFLGNQNTATVIPGHTPQPLGLIT